MDKRVADEKAGRRRGGEAAADDERGAERERQVQPERSRYRKALMISRI